MENEAIAAVRGARYVHTNLVAHDWRRLAQFYQSVFGCVVVPPERDYAGEALDAGTGLTQARLTGVHLRLPGYPVDVAPTLEIYQYEPTAVSLSEPRVNRPGYGHIAFTVENVSAAHAAVLAAGGGTIGDIVTLQTSDGARVTWVYVTDPEGNIIELQIWNR